MKLKFLELQNFRKLSSCKIDIAAEQTLFVGANNSGKTSAMDAIILFLKKSRRRDIAITDFTLSNWPYINNIGNEWISNTDEDTLDLSIERWLPYLPAVDIWLTIDEDDIHHVVNLFPTLDWTPDQPLGVRFIFSPRDTEKLYKAYTDKYEGARSIEYEAEEGGSTKLSLWPKTMRDFLEREIHTHFEVKAYILDPAKIVDPSDNCARPQSLPTGVEPLNVDPFEGLLKIDIIGAQRGFSDPNTELSSYSGFVNLSKQLRNYFSKHLDPSVSPEASDIEALQAIEEARSVFDEKINNSFSGAIQELGSLNYPGFSDPKIFLTSKIQPIDSLKHDTAVQYRVLPESKENDYIALPEQYNGLGYQNLISMVFKLIQFRDEWMRVGKVATKEPSTDDGIEPLHIVLVEEPEAHLHAQVQQVFIKKAFDVLRNNEKLKDNGLFSTQLIVSTHSSHIAHELDFSCLRYFKRLPSSSPISVPCAEVVNLSKTFGDVSSTAKFVKRYIKFSHCDLFFADAVILVEGSAERMLIPYFIQNKFPKLDQSYLSLLEIGGSHAHRLKPLIEILGVPSLVITDLDSIEDNKNAKVVPTRGKGYRTRNTTLKEWIPGKFLLDDLFDCRDEEKQTENGQIRVAYQCPINIVYEGDSEEVYPYTFEDALALSNIDLIKNIENPTGLLGKLQDSLSEENLDLVCESMFDSLKSGSKAEMALDLFFNISPDELNTPEYIYEGLDWLQNYLLQLENDDWLSGE